MIPAEIIFDTLRGGLWTAVVISTPILMTALLVGLAVGLFQALTAIQEMTLTFVPKVGAMLIVMWLSIGFMSQTLSEFFQGTLMPLVAAI